MAAKTPESKVRAILKGLTESVETKFKTLDNIAIQHAESINKLTSLMKTQNEAMIDLVKLTNDLKIVVDKHDVRILELERENKWLKSIVKDLIQAINTDTGDVDGGNAVDTFYRLRAKELGLPER